MKEASSSLLDRNSQTDGYIVDVDPSDGNKMNEYVLQEVKEVELKYNLGNEESDSGYKGILDVSRSSMLYIGTNYQLIHNRSILEAIEKNKDEIKGLELDRIRVINRRQFEFRLLNKGLVFSCGTEDSCIGLTIINSYDGSTSFKVTGSLYIYTCGNGAKLSISETSVTRKHVGVELDIINSIIGSMKNLEKLQHKVETKIWHNDLPRLKEQFKEIKKIFPAKENKPHQSLNIIDQQFRHNSVKMDKEFALFMALTNITSYPDKYDIGTSYVRAIENKIDNVFFYN